MCGWFAGAIIVLILSVVNATRAAPHTPTPTIHTPSGACALELVPHTIGHLARCAATGVTFSGLVVNCKDLGERESACAAATRTMAQGGRSVAAPSQPMKKSPQK